jgi:hypothetical protein
MVYVEDGVARRTPWEEEGSIWRSTAPDYAEPIVAWRLWSVVREKGLVLRSLFHPFVWPRRQPLHATCERWRPLARMIDRHHDTPGDRCTCGIYAADLSVIGDYLGEPPAGGVESVPRVVGLVSLWGSVLECDHGWRASHGYPAALFVPVFASGTETDPPPDEIARELGEYGVPVEIVTAAQPQRLIESLERESLPVTPLTSLGGAQ